jgi:release factor glutamine methyltransferase
VANQIFPVCSDLIASLSGSFQLILANLPYIPSEDPDLATVAAFEPRLALDGGPDGLCTIFSLLIDSPRCFSAPGLMLLEIEERQGEAVQKFASQIYPSATISIIPDLAKKPRLVKIEVF